MSPPSSNPSHLFGWDFFLKIIINLGEFFKSNLFS